MECVRISKVLVPHSASVDPDACIKAITGESTASVAELKCTLTNKINKDPIYYQHYFCNFQYFF